VNLSFYPYIHVVPINLMSNFRSRGLFFLLTSRISSTGMRKHKQPARQGRPRRQKILSVVRQRFVSLLSAERQTGMTSLGTKPGQRREERGRERVFIRRNGSRPERDNEIALILGLSAFENRLRAGLV